MLKRTIVIAGVALALSICSLTVRADEAPATETPAPSAPAVVEPAPEKDWSVTVGGDWFSEYIFRGVDLLDDTAVYVPSVVARYKGLTVYYFGYYGDGKKAVPGNKWYEETDVGADWTQNVLDGKFSLTAGGLAYWYLDGVSGKDTYELYGKATWNSYLNPYIAINWDIDEFHGGYGAVGITHSYDLSKPLHLPDGMVLSIVPSAQLGIDFGYNSRKTQDNANFNDVLVGVSVPFNITPALCIHAAFQVSIAMNSLNDIGQHNERIGNVGVSYTF